jgi:hypothetical protein
MMNGGNGAVSCGTRTVPGYELVRACGTSNKKAFAGKGKGPKMDRIINFQGSLHSFTSALEITTGMMTSDSLRTKEYYQQGTKYR